MYLGYLERKHSCYSKSTDDNLYIVYLFEFSHRCFDTRSKPIHGYELRKYI